MQHTAHTSLPQTAGFAHPPRNVGAMGIEPGMTVADFGSGSGAYALLFAEMLQGVGRVYAIDVQKDLLQRTKNEARRRGLDTLDIIWGDLEKPHGSKIADRAIDFVLISNLLFQLEDKSAPVREAARILRPRGRLAIVDWSDSFGGMGPIKSQTVKKERALELAQDVGFELEREFNAGAHHYGLIFRQMTRQTP